MRDYETSQKGRRRWQQRYVVALTVLLAALAAPAAAEPVANTSIPALLDLYAASGASRVPALTPDEVKVLLAGDAVVKVSGEPATDDSDELTGVGVYGLKIVDAPRLLIWLAVMGGNDERDWRLTSAMLSRSADGSYVRYQHINLPWPVRDRHWVIHCEKNPQIAIDSRGLIWEHRWRLQENGIGLLDNAVDQRRVPGMTADIVNEAVYLPENQGAWTMLELGQQRTLVIGYLNADLGGRFPAPVVRHFTRRNLKAGLASLQELSSRVHLNYSEEPPIHDGFGNLVSRQDALQAAAAWQGSLQIAGLD